MSNLTTVKELKGLLDNPMVQEKLKAVIGKNIGAFTTSIVQIASQNEMLAKAEPNSIIGAAMTAATLNLPLNNALGQAFLVPFNEKQKDGSYKVKAQFILGAKGLRQLAQRSGQYKEMYAKEIYEGQLIEDESFLGYHFDWKNKKSDKIIGYASYYKLLNGFESYFYMTIEDVTKHGKQFSQTFKKGFGLWKDSFEKMAIKTVNKLHLNQGEAPLSLDMSRAIETDQAVNNFNEEDGTIDVTYPDNDEPEHDHSAERMRLLVEEAVTLDDIEFAEQHVTDPVLIAELDLKKIQIKKASKK